MQRTQKVLKEFSEAELILRRELASAPFISGDHAGIVSAPAEVRSLIPLGGILSVTIICDAGHTEGG